MRIVLRVREKWVEGDVRVVGWDEGSRELVLEVPDDPALLPGCPVAITVTQGDGGKVLSSGDLAIGSKGGLRLLK